jgi:hypothetical protein
MMTAAKARPMVRKAVVAPSSCQVLDMACVDIFGMMSIEYFNVMNDMPSTNVLALAPEIIYAYISALPNGSPLQLTAGMSVGKTYHMSDPKVAVGELEVVLAPGPISGKVWAKDTQEWLRA